MREVPAVAHTAETLQAAFKYLFVDEVPELKRLARSIKSKNPVIVNIGAGAGTSSLAFLEARDDVRVIGIDKQKESNPYGCLEAEMEMAAQAGLDDRLDQYHGDSKKAGVVYPDSGVNLVFIDGDHSFEGCAGDIISWIRNIKKGGLMSVHDYGKRELFKNGPRENAPAPKPWPGVDGAVDLLLFPNFELVSKVESLVTFRMPS